MQERITGRFIAETITDPDTGEAVTRRTICVRRSVQRCYGSIKKQGRDSIKIRTVLTCKSHIGVCAKCYGANMATGQPVQVGEASASSRHSPSVSLAQLTMRSPGGVAGGDISHRSSACREP